MPDPLAIYAAIVGTLGLGWQVWRETRRLKTDVRVEFEHASASRPIYAAAIPDPDLRPYPIEYELSVVIVNGGETTEFVRNIWVEDAARSAGCDLSPDDDQQLRPRARFVSSLRPEEQEVDFSNGFIGIVRLASGRFIESSVHQLDAGIIDVIAEHNRTARP